MLTPASLPLPLPIPGLFHRLGRARILGRPGPDWAAFLLMTMLSGLAFPLLWVTVHGIEPDPSEVETVPVAKVEVEQKAPVGRTVTANKGAKTKKPKPKNAPSFDCTKARTAIEREICVNSTLAALDRRMVGTYRRLLSTVVPINRNNVRAGQVEWFQRYNAACNALAKDRTALVSCIHSHLIRREMELSLQVQ